MTSLEELIKKAQELKSRGLSTYQIADELKVHPDTVVCLLLRGKEGVKKLVPHDVFVDWSPIGSNIKRLSLTGQALADLVRDSIGKGEFDEPEVVVGVEGSGMALGVIVAEQLSKPFAAVKPQRIEKKLTGAIDTSFFSAVSNRKALIVDSIIRAGETIEVAAQTLSEAGAKPVGIAVLANKSGRDKLNGIPLKALIQLLPVSKS